MKKFTKILIILFSVLSLSYTPVYGAMSSSDSNNSNLYKEGKKLVMA